MNSPAPPSDEEMIRRIRDAFNQQGVPECPSADELFGRMEWGPAATNSPVSFVSNKGSNWVASLMATAAMVGIAVFLFGSTVDDPELETAQDNVVDLTDPNKVEADVVEAVELAGQPEKSDRESKDVPSQDDPGEAPSTGLLNTIAAVNDFLAGRSDEPDRLIDHLHEHFGLELTRELQGH